MNWNSYDTKYIIKRLIIGFGMLILFTLLTTLKANAEQINDSNIRYVINNDSNLNVWTLPSTTQSLSSPVWLSDEYMQINSTGTGKYISGRLIFTGEFYHHNSATGISASNINNPRIKCGKTNNGSFTFTNEFTLNTTIVYNMVTNQTNSRIPSAFILIADINGESSIELDTNSKILCRLYNSGNSNGIIKMQTGDSWQRVLNEFVTGNQSIPTQANIVVSRDATDAINAFANQNHNDLNNINNSINNQSNQQHQDAQDINNSINNDNITTSDADDLMNNQAFSDSTGLEAVINLPLNMINSLTNTCQPINITIPWLDYTGSIPCMSTIYRSKFNNLYQVVKLIINGFLVYRLLLKVYELVHEAKQPDEDKLEVIDL